MSRIIPMPLNNKAYASIDVEYYRNKELDNSVTYSVVAMRRELKRIEGGDAHASLGTNVIDREEKGQAIFEYYGTIVDIAPSTRVLEFGCGSLRVGSKYIEYLEPGCFFGMDVEPGLIEIGKRLLPQGVLAEKCPLFADTSPAALQRAEEFKAEFVYANSVVFHIHHEDLEEFCRNLARVTSRPGATLVFDARLSEHPVRYTSRGWAWPLELYKELLAPLELVKLHNAKPYKGVPGCTSANLEFRSK